MRAVMKVLGMGNELRFIFIYELEREGDSNEKGHTHLNGFKFSAD